MIDRNVLKLMRDELSKDSLLKEKMGDSIKELITFKPSLNITELNKISGAKHFITMSCNRVTDQGTSNQLLFKVGVALPANSTDEEILDVFDITSRVKEILCQHQLVFGLPEQLEFAEMDEAYFDSEQEMWGYVMMFISKDAK